MTKPRYVSRRDFAAQSLLAVAATAAGRALAQAPAVGARVRGANDRVVLANLGIRGQGNSLKRGFASLPNVEIKTLCDPDENLFAERANDKRLSQLPNFHPAYQRDLRRVFDDKDIDGVLIAMPNHWHALAAIWAMQAGKHVFVEKPSSHTVWEGRKMYEAQQRYGVVLQCGTMNRSRALVREAVQFMREGGIGKLEMARALCFKARPAIGKYPDGPMKAGEKYRLNVESREDEPTYDDAYLAKVDYDLWLGPAPKRAFNRNHFHYNWHWHWAYGNGDTGNQGPHQYDLARWGLGKNEHPVKISSMGGYFGPASSQETPTLQTTLYQYADGTQLEFGTRGGYTNDEGTQKIGNLFYGSEGWLWIDGNGRHWQSYVGRSNEKGKGAHLDSGGSDPNVATSMELPHYQNFVDAIRAGDPSKVNCGALDGHLSSALPHMANISYRVGRALTFDGQKEKFVNDSEADKLLTREYRAPFVIPERV